MKHKNKKPKYKEKTSKNRYTVTFSVCKCDYKNKIKQNKSFLQVPIAGVVKQLHHGSGTYAQRANRVICALGLVEKIK